MPESVDPDSVSPTRPYRAMKQLGLVLLCGAWVVLGLFGRDPWKTEDAVTFAIAWEMVQRNDWLVPHVAQEVALHQQPLVPWLAALGLVAGSSVLQAPDAARLAVGLLLALLLAGTGLAGRELSGRAFRWLPVLIVVGTVGLFDRSHQLSADLGLAVAVVFAIFGTALALRRPWLGGAVLGIATAAAFLAAGWRGALWSYLPALLLPLAGKAWRSRAHAATLATAAAVSLPLAAAWPVALALRSPELLRAWRLEETLGEHFAFVPGMAAADPWWLLRTLVWAAWPALPLVGWMLWIRGRGYNGGLRDPGAVIPGVFALALLAGMAVMPDPNTMQLLPLLAPLALLGALEVDSLKRGNSAALDWFGILTFGLTALVLWAFWFDGYFNGMSARVAIALRDSETGYALAFNLRAFLAALFLTALWITLVRPARRSNRRAVLNWAAGMTLVWGLIATIWMPYLNARRTYEAVGQSLGVYRPTGACIARANVGEAQRALFYYYAGIVTVDRAKPDAAACPALLVQYGRLAEGVPALPGYRVKWQGGRRGDAGERFVLYERVRR